MSDAVAETGPQPTSDKAVEVAKPLSPEKSQLISQALERFDRVRDGARRLGFMDQQFGERLGSGLHVIEADVNNANSREVGAREANQLAANLSELLRPQLKRIVQDGEALGLGTDPIRTDLEEMLHQAASETDPIKAFSVASKAVERFNSFSDGVIQKRRVQRAAEQQAGDGIQENQQRANYIYQRVTDQLRMRLEDGILDRFRLNSGRLLRTAEEVFQSLSKTDKAFLEDTDEGKIMFKKIVDSLIEIPSESAVKVNTEQSYVEQPQASGERLPDLTTQIDLKDIVYAPSTDLAKGLMRNGLDPTPELQAKIRAAKSLEELRQLGLSDDILRSIKEGTFIIKDEEIPAWMKDKVQEMIQFAVSNGAEIEEGVGSKNGFYHVHIGVSKGTVFTGNRQAVWEQVQQNATLLLGHTQELKAFDKSKRSIVLGLKQGDKPVILPAANPEGTVQITDPQFIQAGFPETVEAGTLYFYDEQGKGRQFSSALTVG